MEWITVAIILIHCGLTFATGTFYPSSFSSYANRNEKKVILVGSGPLPQYLLQSGFEILPIFGDFRNFSPPRVRKRSDENKIPKRIFSGKIAPFTSISRTKKIRRKSDVPITMKPLKLKNKPVTTFSPNKNLRIVMKPVPIKDGKVAIPIITPKEIVIKSPQIVVKSDKNSSPLTTSTPQPTKKNQVSISSVPQGKVKNPLLLPIKVLPSSKPSKSNGAFEKLLVPSQLNQFNALTGISLSNQKYPQWVSTLKSNKQISKPLPSPPTKSAVTTSMKTYTDKFIPSKRFPQPADPALVNIVKNNQQILKQSPSLPITNTGTVFKSSDVIPNSISNGNLVNFNSDYAKIATPLTVVNKKPPLEILKPIPEVYSNPEPYAFGYEMGDGLGTTQYRRESTKGDGVVKGNYGYKDFKGIFRQVNYVADKGGFHAVVKSNEPGIGYADSADVKILADYSPS